MKVLFLFLCFLFVSCKISYDEWMDPGASISTSDSTFEEQNCHVDNDCSLIPGRPYCIQNTCRECNPEIRDHIKKCMCPLNHYCVSYPNDSEYGFCRERESTILNRNCDASITDPMSLVKGVNDTVYCGKIVFANDLTAEFVEWSSVCVVGVCKQCSEPIIPSLPLIFCNDGRTCKLNEEVYTPTGIMSLNYALDVPVSFGTIVLFIEFSTAVFAVLFAAYGVAYYKFLRYKYKSSQKQGYYEID